MSYGNPGALWVLWDNFKALPYLPALPPRSKVFVVTSHKGRERLQNNQMENVLKLWGKGSLLKETETEMDILSFLW